MPNNGANKKAVITIAESHENTLSGCSALPKSLRFKTEVIRQLPFRLRRHKDGTPRYEALGTTKIGRIEYVFFMHFSGFLWFLSKTLAQNPAL